MPLLRLVTRVILFPVMFLPLILPILTSHLLPYRLKRHSLSYITMYWMRMSCWIMGIKVRISGDYKSAPGGMIASNHVSWMDILVVGSLKPGVFVSKQDVIKWPFMGQLAWSVNTIFLDRESKRDSASALDELKDIAESGVSFVVFPESKSSAGTEVLPFKTMFFEVAARTGVPIIPVSLAYDSTDVPWYGGMKIGPHIKKMLVTKTTVASVHFGQTIYKEEGVESRFARKILCAKTEEAVRTGLDLARDELAAA